MCGIVGYIGDNEVVPVLMDGLRRLEYRGYDSAGVALVDADGKLEEFEVKYVFGFTPLQQYMVEMPDSVERAEGEKHEDAPEGWKKTRIFELDREVAVKRRSHYA